MSATDDLHDAIQTMIFYKQAQDDMKRAQEEMAKGNPDAAHHLRFNLMLTLHMDKFGGQKKEYTPEEWTLLVTRAREEGKGTTKLAKSIEKLAELQFCLGEKTLEEVETMCDFDAQVPTNSTKTKHTNAQEDGRIKLPPRPPSRRSTRRNTKNKNREVDMPMCRSAPLPFETTDFPPKKQMDGWNVRVKHKKKTRKRSKGKGCENGLTHSLYE